MRRIATAILAVLTLSSSTPAMCDQCHFVQANTDCGAKHGKRQTLHLADSMKVMSHAHCEHEGAALAQTQRAVSLSLFSLGSLQFPCKNAPELTADVNRFGSAQFSDAVTVPVGSACERNAYQAVRLDLNVGPSQHRTLIPIPSISLRI